MSQQRRKIEILVETHNMTIIRTGRQRFSTYCRECQTDVATFSVQQLRRWLESIRNGDAHLIESGDGSLVCANSLEGKTL